MKTLVLATVSAAALLVAGAASAADRPMSNSAAPTASDLPTIQQYAPSGYSSAVQITQIGSNQNAYDDSRNAGGSYAQIVQGSNSNDQQNTATINQGQYTSNERGMTAQYGRNNTATTTQNGNHETGVTSQIGYSNTSTINQSGSGDNYKNADNSGVSMFGNGLTATSWRESNQAHSDIRVFNDGVGGLNAVQGAYVAQIGSGNTAGVTQGGSGNTAIVYQRGNLDGGLTYATGYNNTSVTQTGSSDKALVLQSGIANGTGAGAGQGYLSQTGNNDMAVVFETGNRNNFYVTQASAQNYVSIAQTGAYNYAQVQH